MSATPKKPAKKPAAKKPAAKKPVRRVRAGDLVTTPSGYARLKKKKKPKPSEEKKRGWL